MTAADDAMSTDLAPDGPIDDHDRAHLAHLATAWTRIDPVPPGLVGAVTFAVALDEVWAEVAHIQRQGSRGPLAGVRGGSEATAVAPGMSFSSSDLSMTIMTSPGGSGRLRIDGWVTPDGGGAVGLRLADETRRQVPEQGRFWFDDVPNGLVQFFVEATDGEVRMITPAVDL